MVDSAEKKVGPWGLTEPDPNTPDVRIAAIHQATDYVAEKVGPLLEQMGIDLDIDTFINSLANVGSYTLIEDKGDVSKLVPEVQQIVKDINTDFLTRNIKLEASASYVAKSETVDKPGIVFAFLSR